MSFNIPPERVSLVNQINSAERVRLDDLDIDNFLGIVDEVSDVPTLKKTTIRSVGGEIAASIRLGTVPDHTYAQDVLFSGVSGPVDRSGVSYTSVPFNSGAPADTPDRYIGFSVSIRFASTTTDTHFSTELSRSLDGLVYVGTDGVGNLRIPNRRTRSVDVRASHSRASINVTRIAGIRRVLTLKSVFN